MNKSPYLPTLVMALMVSDAAVAKQITVEIPHEGVPTHNGGSSVAAIQRNSTDSCSVSITFARRPKILIASFVGRPYSVNSGEAPALLTSIANPVDKRYEFGCLQTEQIFYRDSNNRPKSTLSLKGNGDSGAALHLDVTF